MPEVPEILRIGQFVYRNIPRHLKQISYLFDRCVVNLVIMPDKDPKTYNEYRKTKSNEIKECMSRYNSMIGHFNRIIQNEVRPLNLPKIKKIDNKLVLKLIKEMAPSKERPSITGLTENRDAKIFRLKISNIINEVENTLIEFENKFLSDNDLFNLVKQKSKYKAELEEASNIFLLGHYRTAVLVAGRTLERCCNDYLKLLKKAKKSKLKHREIKELSFESKLGHLKSIKAIKPVDYNKLMSIKWDRNVGGHPSSSYDIRKLSNDSESIIKIAINQVTLISNKIRTLENKHMK